MNRSEFLELVQSKIVVLDGATGSNLQDSGMVSGVCPETWILENERTLIELQKGYLEAGSDIVYAPTFTANRVKLEEYGLEDQIAEINEELVLLSRKAIEEANIGSRKAYIAGDLTMTGEQLYPMGKMMFEELVDIYKEQVSYILMAGVDLFVVETMLSLQECRAAVLAIKELCDLPILVTLTFNDDGRTLYGTTPEAAVVVLQELGAAAVGVNCSTGPDKMAEVVRRMKSVANVPIIAKPNAGMPVLVDGKTIYNMDAYEFAEKATLLIEAGANIVGGCCGTTILHMNELAKKAAEHMPSEIRIKKQPVLSTERSILPIDIDGKFMVIGERINPTGKKPLQAELRAGELDLVLEFAEEQVEAGANILDINMGTNGIDEKEMMVKAIYEVTRVVDVPLCIDSSHIEVIEAALRIYPGRALINSISFEKEKFERLLPIAKKYGAMFILLPLSEKGLPKDMGEKKYIIDTIIARAEEIGLSKQDIIVDALVNTVGANKKAALEALETITYCKKTLGVATACGLSNISFGLPERQFVNSAFLSFAIREGLTMAIANPCQELLMNLAFASDLLLNKEEADIRYITQVSNHPITVSKKDEQTGKNLSNSSDRNELQNEEKTSIIYEEVLKGNRKHIVSHVEEAITAGEKPSVILDEMLIPAINKVGDLFDKQIYYLPQLIASAETMKTAIDYLEPLLKEGQDGGKLGTIIIATVAGDIHDIGKNLVALMLKNYGFEVIDLGKDVPSEKIIEEAKKHDADIIGLSALMTTTMMEMKTVVKLKNKENLRAKVIIGGAVTTPSFAKEIGADGYSTDAQDAVRLVKELLSLS
ncbi:MAG: homocysteine S-methyltransferase family protein [bacterium]|nr:homocysteine S-methyltransferase family protein [bacterium]